MKRRTLYTLITSLLMSIGTLHAQIGERRNDLSIGLNGGYVWNKVSFNPTIKQSFHNGINFGATLRYTSEKYFSCVCALQAEVNYTQLGWEELIETSTDTYERTVNYVQIPFLARLGWGRERRGLMGYIILGPQIGFYLNDKDKRGTSDDLPGWTDHTLSLRPNRVTAQYDLSIQNTFEYGITGGAGMELSTKVGHFLVEGRYYFGLSDMFHNSKKDAFGRSANGAIIAKVTYLFDLIKTKNDRIK